MNFSEAFGHTALGDAVFRKYFYATMTATLSVWMMRFLIGWTAWEITHSALWVGIASAVLLAPTFFLSPIFGVLSDRTDPRNGIVMTSVANAIIACVLGVYAWQALLGLNVLLVGAFCFGCVTAAHHPYRLALVPNIIPHYLLPSAIGYASIIFNLSRIIGPALAALLLKIGGLSEAVFVAAVLFMLTCLLLLKIPPVIRINKTRKISFFLDFRAGLSLVKSNELIGSILLMTFVNGMIGRSLMEILPALSGQLLGGSANALALLTAMAGLGAIIGGVLVSRQKGDAIQLSQLVHNSLILGSLILMPVMWATNLLGLLLIIVIASGSMTIIGTGCQALLQMLVADAFRGRVMSIWTVVSMGTPAFGAFIMGAMADFMGFGVTLLILASMSLTANIYFVQNKSCFHELISKTNDNVC